MKPTGKAKPNIRNRYVVSVLLLLLALATFAVPAAQAAGPWIPYGKIGPASSPILGGFNRPTGVAADSSGNVYVADSSNNRIQKYTASTGVWSQWGGTIGSSLGQFFGPGGVAVDSDGNVYVADTNNNRIEKLNVSTGVWNAWGKSDNSYGSGLGEFYGPSGVAVDSEGNVYVADTSNHRVQKLTVATGVWSEWPKSYGYGYGTGLGDFWNPLGVAVDSNGNVYVADSLNHRIQKLTVSTGVWSAWGKSGGGNGSGLGEFNSPAGVAVDRDGNVYVADQGNARIQKLTVSTGVWSDWVKSGGGAGSGLGEFSNPTGVATDSVGNVYVADQGNERVQKWTASTGGWSQWVGSGPVSGPLLGEFNFPLGAAVDSWGNVYVADTNNNRIQKLTASTGVWSSWGKTDGSNGSGLGEFNKPSGVAVDSQGNVYVADTNNSRIQKLTISTGEWSSWGKSGGGNGSALGEFNRPGGVAVDSQGNVYVADTYNVRIQKLTVSTGVWSEWKKVGGGVGSGLGEFFLPSGVAVDDSGNVYVADKYNNRIQKLTASTGAWSEWEKSGGGSGTGLGEFYRPTGVAVDGQGNVFVADTSNARIQKLTVSTGAWSEIGKSGGGTGSGEFFSPSGVAVGNDGTLYVADSGNHRIQQLVMPGSPTEVAAAAGNEQAIISFTTPASDGGSAITGYTVTANPGGITATGTTSPITVTGLTNGTPYTFTVVATNSNGHSAASSAVTVTPQIPAPGAPVLQPPIASNAQVTLTWHPVTGSTGYKVFQSVTATTYGNEVATVSGSVYGYNVTNAVYSSTVTGLTNGTTYYFTLKAVNAGGDSPASNQVSAVPVTVPGAPTGLIAVAENGQATIKFQAPADNGGSPISGYEVMASPGNGAVSGTASPIVVAGLTNGTSYTFTVKAINAVGKSLASAESNAVIPQAPYEPAASAAPAATPDTKPTVDILVNGKAESAGTATTVVRNDQTVTTILVDPNILEDKLSADGPSAIVTIPVKNNSDVVVGVLNGQMVKNMEDKQAVLEIQTDRATYTLPAQQINIDAISGEIGKQVALQDIKVQIEIAAPTSDTMKVVEQAASQQSFTLVAPPLNFTVKGTYGDKTIDVTNFNAYVERTIAIPAGVDPTKITTGVVVDPDGTVRHVPTKVVNVDGKYYTEINSLTNSTYTVVWHPIEFQDVADHWGKMAINDMGSRMVMEGTGDGMFNPDQAISRAEFAAILVRGLGLRLNQGGTPFADVQTTDWFNGAIHTAYDYHLISGFEDGTFRPMDKITREQAMVILAKAMAITGLKDKLSVPTVDALLQSYADKNDISAWAVSSVEDSVAASLVSGRSGAELAPKGDMTRAEVATIIQKLLQKSGLI